MVYVVKSYYKCDIIFNTWSQGGAEAEGNKLQYHMGRRDLTDFYPSVQ